MIGDAESMLREVEVMHCLLRLFLPGQIDGTKQAPADNTRSCDVIEFFT